MLKVIDLRGKPVDPARVGALLPRAQVDVAKATASVEPILREVRERGAAAVLDLGEKFDNVRPPALRVPQDVIDRAVDGLDRDVRAGLEEAIRRTRLVHKAQVPLGGTVTVAPGGTVTQRWMPVRRVGLYVPGGLAVYPSSVVMNAVPAQAAGVQELALASPPQAAFGGWPHPTILAACGLLGVTEVYAAGGAQAIALFAYGAAGDDGGAACAPVDVVTGPGNVYVAAAKRLVRGLVGIDAEAGPTEIMVLADAGANPEFVAADLVSQAEHDPLAGSVLVTTSPELAAAVDRAVAARAAATPNAERVRQALTGTQSGVVLVDTVQDLIAVADAYGAEHLEVQTDDAPTVASRVRNAGAIFVGPYSPVPLGDYIAGSNHVLPTGGTARFASGLGVTAFLKSMQVVHYSKEALAEVAPLGEAIARAEALPAHAEAFEARL
ncbi:MAG: histidinol dehydrogenase [Bifidobacteriaceae bacterium]|nr:histidinol dehydrogenase [Bifidobacteriaceae bacterium]